MWERTYWVGGTEIDGFSSWILSAIGSFLLNLLAVSIALPLIFPSVPVTAPIGVTILAYLCLGPDKMLKLILNKAK